MLQESPQVLVLEFVENGCLRDYLKKFKDTIDFKQLLRFGYEIALVCIFNLNSCYFVMFYFLINLFSHS